MTRRPARRAAARNGALLLGPQGISLADLGGRDLETRAVPGPVRRAVQHVRSRRSKALEWELSWLERLSALATAAPPRVLLRVDEFPCSTSFDQPESYGLERAAAFHEVLAASEIPYLMAIVPQLTHAPLDPGAEGGRKLDASELGLIERMRSDGVTFALHGSTHRTRHRSPRRRSEFTGLSNLRLGALLDRGIARMAEIGIEPRVLVPPFNRFSAGQIEVFAKRFDVVTGGPESIRLVGAHHGPMWREDLVYMPCLPPLYGTAREVLPALERLLESAPGVWIPICLHLSWELNDDLIGLRELVDSLTGVATSWRDFLAAVDRSRQVG